MSPLPERSQHYNPNVTGTWCCFRYTPPCFSDCFPAITSAFAPSARHLGRRQTCPEWYDQAAITIFSFAASFTKPWLSLFFCCLFHQTRYKGRDLGLAKYKMGTQSGPKILSCFYALLCVLLDRDRVVLCCPALSCIALCCLSRLVLCFLVLCCLVLSCLVLLLLLPLPCLVSSCFVLFCSIFIVSIPLSRLFLLFFLCSVFLSFDAPPCCPTTKNPLFPFVVHPYVLSCCCLVLS